MYTVNQSLTLTQVYGHPRKDLMTFTCMSKPVPTRLLRLQYRVVLAKIESGKLKVSVRTILNTVLKHRHVFRGGTCIDDNTGRHKYYEDLIATCKAERDGKKTVTKESSGMHNLPPLSYSHQTYENTHT